MEEGSSVEKMRQKDPLHALVKTDNLRRSDSTQQLRATRQHQARLLTQQEWCQDLWRRWKRSWQQRPWNVTRRACYSRKPTTGPTPWKRRRQYSDVSAFRDSNQEWRANGLTCALREASTWIRMELDRLANFQFDRLHEHTMEGIHVRQIGMMPREYGFPDVYDHIKQVTASLKGTQSMLKAFQRFEEAIGTILYVKGHLRPCRDIWCYSPSALKVRPLHQHTTTVATIYDTNLAIRMLLRSTYFFTVL